MQNKINQKQSLDYSPAPGTVYHRTNNPKRPWQLNTVESSQTSKSIMPVTTQEDEISEAVSQVYVDFLVTYSGILITIQAT